MDLRDAAAEAYEGVENGLMTPEDFRDFVLVNPIKLHCGMNPDFFKGTIVEHEAAKVMREVCRGRRPASASRCWPLSRTPRPSVAPREPYFAIT